MLFCRQLEQERREAGAARQLVALDETPECVEVERPQAQAELQLRPAQLLRHPARQAARRRGQRRGEVELP